MGDHRIGSQQDNAATRRKPTGKNLMQFVHAFRCAVETEYLDGRVPPLWIRNGYDDARELCGLDPETWPAPWERGETNPVAGL